MVGIYVHLRLGGVDWEEKEGRGSKGPVRRVYDVPRAQELEAGLG